MLGVGGTPENVPIVPAEQGQKTERVSLAEKVGALIQKIGSCKSSKELRIIEADVKNLTAPPLVSFDVSEKVKLCKAEYAKKKESIEKNEELEATLQALSHKGMTAAQAQNLLTFYNAKEGDFILLRNEQNTGWVVVQKGKIGFHTKALDTPREQQALVSKKEAALPADFILLREKVEKISSYLQLAKRVEKEGLRDPLLHSNYLEAKQALATIFESVMRMSDSEIETLRCALKKKHPALKDAIDSHLLSYKYELKPQHYSHGTTKVSIPEKPPGFEVRGLLAALDSAKFTNKEREALGENPKKSLEDFVGWVERREVRTAVPADKEKFYKDIENAIAATLAKIDSLSKGSAQDKEKADSLKKVLVQEALQVALFCGTKQLMGAIDIYRHIVLGHDLTRTTENLVHEMAGNWRDLILDSLITQRVFEAKERLKTIPRERLQRAPDRLTDQEREDWFLVNQSIHYKSALVIRLGKELGIPGYNLLTEHDDKFKKNLTPQRVEEERMRFQANYTELSLVNNIYDQCLFDEDLRSRCIDYFRAHMPAGAADDFMEKEIIEMRADGKFGIKKTAIAQMLTQMEVFQTKGDWQARKALVSIAQSAPPSSITEKQERALKLAHLFVTLGADALTSKDPVISQCAKQYLQLFIEVIKESPEHKVAAQLLQLALHIDPKGKIIEELFLEPMPDPAIKMLMRFLEHTLQISYGHYRFDPRLPSITDPKMFTIFTRLQTNFRALESAKVPLDDCRAIAYFFAKNFPDESLPLGLNKETLDRYFLTILPKEVDVLDATASQKLDEYKKNRDLYLQAAEMAKKIVPDFIPSKMPLDDLKVDELAARCEQCQQAGKKEKQVLEALFQAPNALEEAINAYTIALSQISDPKVQKELSLEFTKKLQQALMLPQEAIIDAILERPVSDEEIARYKAQIEWIEKNSQLIKKLDPAFDPKSVQATLSPKDAVRMQNLYVSDEYLSRQERVFIGDRVVTRPDKYLFHYSKDGLRLLNVSTNETFDSMKKKDIDDVLKTWAKRATHAPGFDKFKAVQPFLTGEKAPQTSEDKKALIAFITEARDSGLEPPFTSERLVKCVQLLKKIDPANYQAHIEALLRQFKASVANDKLAHNQNRVHNFLIAKQELEIVRKERLESSLEKLATLFSRVGNEIPKDLVLLDPDFEKAEDEFFAKLETFARQIVNIGSSLEGAEYLDYYNRNIFDKLAKNAATINMQKLETLASRLSGRGNEYTYDKVKQFLTANKDKVGANQAELEKLATKVVNEKTAQAKNEFWQRLRKLYGIDPRQTNLQLFTTCMKELPAKVKEVAIELLNAEEVKVHLARCDRALLQIQTDPERCQAAIEEFVRAVNLAKPHMSKEAYDFKLAAFLKLLNPLAAYPDSFRHAVRAAISFSYELPYFQDYWDLLFESKLAGKAPFEKQFIMLQELQKHLANVQLAKSASSIKAIAPLYTTVQKGYLQVIANLLDRGPKTTNQAHLVENCLRELSPLWTSMDEYLAATKPFQELDSARQLTAPQMQARLAFFKEDAALLKRFQVMRNETSYGNTTNRVMSFILFCTKVDPKLDENVKVLFRKALQEARIIFKTDAEFSEWLLYLQGISKHEVYEAVTLEFIACALPAGVLAENETVNSAFTKLTAWIEEKAKSPLQTKVEKERFTETLKRFRQISNKQELVSYFEKLKAKAPINAAQCILCEQLALKPADAKLQKELMALLTKRSATPHRTEDEKAFFQMGLKVADTHCSKHPDFATWRAALKTSSS